LPAALRRSRSSSHAGVNLGLGTDGAASNNRLDLFQEMRLAALLGKQRDGRADAIDAHQVLRMATLGGACALGLDADIGSIAVGKWADLCAVSFDDVALVPCYDPVSHLAYAAGREHVSDVWGCGKHTRREWATGRKRRKRIDQIGAVVAE
jgi:5-methylthioadenosine/S-adenosylhomocysteine deaminase